MLQQLGIFYIFEKCKLGFVRLIIPELGVLGCRSQTYIQVSKQLEKPYRKDKNGKN